MASLLTGEASHHGAADGNFKVSQEKLEGGGCWYFSRKEIEENSPSRQDGIDLKKENYLRRSYSKFLQELGEKLKVPQPTIATAIVFCHRFFLRQSHARHDRKIIAIACLYLAGKTEETPRPAKDLILVSYGIMYDKDAAPVQRIKQKEVYKKKRELILLGERVVLGTLAFDLDIHHPYLPLIQAIQKFKFARSALAALAQVAWNFVNDGLRTSLCLQYQPHQIAAGAIFLAAKYLKLKLPSDGEKAWWQDYGITPCQLLEYSNQMLELYEEHAVPPFQASGTEGIEGRGKGDDEGNCAGNEPTDGEELKDENLSNKDVTVGQSPQDAAKNLDGEKLKATFEGRKACEDITCNVDPMDELERELEDVEISGESDKTNRKRKQSWSKASRSEHDNSHCGDAQYKVLKDGDGFDLLEELGQIARGSLGSLGDQKYSKHA